MPEIGRVTFTSHSLYFLVLNFEISMPPRDETKNRETNESETVKIIYITFVFLNHLNMFYTFLSSNSKKNSGVFVVVIN